MTFECAADQSASWRLECKARRELSLVCLSRVSRVAVRLACVLYSRLGPGTV